MKSRPSIHAYLAGPDVFYPNAVAIGQAKKSRLAELGITGHYPFDNVLPDELFKNPQKAARTIADMNEQQMDFCCKPEHIGIIFVNMNPFHGPSLDCGTAFEMGYMSALSKKGNVIIMGYSAEQRNFEERVIQDIYNGEGITHKNGLTYGSDGNLIESFGGADNLMIVSAIERTGGKLCNTFEEAALLAKEIAQSKINLQSNAGPERFINDKPFDRSLL